MGRVWETADRRDLATSLALRNGRGEGRTRTRARPSRLRAIAGRKPRDETRPRATRVATMDARCHAVVMTVENQKETTKRA